MHDSPDDFDATFIQNSSQNQISKTRQDLI